MSPRNPFDDDTDDDASESNPTTAVNAPQANVVTSSSTRIPTGQTKLAEATVRPVTLTAEQIRAQRLREEVVRRLAADISQVHTTDGTLLDDSDTDLSSNSVKDLLDQPLIVPLGQDESVLSSTIAAAIERGLDRELHGELTKQIKISSGTISKICHDHSDAFLASIGRVASLGSSSEEIKAIIQQANEELQQNTGGSMFAAASLLQYVRNAEIRARTIHGLVQACHEVASLLEKCRKQASLHRPNAALDTLQEAKAYLTAPLSSILMVPGGMQLLLQERDNWSTNLLNIVDSSTDGSNKATSVTRENNLRSQTNEVGSRTSASSNTRFQSQSMSILTLQQTPFGSYAMKLLPKIESEILQDTRRGLSKWFLSIRSGGDGIKIGRSALRRCATSLAIGTGQVGLGGITQSYSWRAKHADNLIARINQNSRLARAVRMCYWYDRDCKMEVELLETFNIGVERKAEALACAFGWYRCWTANAVEDIEVMKSLESEIVGDSSTKINQSLDTSSQSSKHTSLSFRSTSSSRLAGSRDITKSKGRMGETKKQRCQWSSVLVPNIILDDTQSRNDDDEKFSSLSESLHPVYLAEAAYAHVGKADEFRAYYEQNRFGDVKIFDGRKGDDGYEKETRSSLSSLTGDDVSQGTDRTFFSKSLPQFCASIVGFSAVEAELELGKIYSLDSFPLASDVKKDTIKQGSASQSYSYADQSSRYERNLIGECGNLYRARAIGATLAELARASTLISVFRSTLNTVHPSSTTRKLDRDLLATDVDVLMTGLKIAQEEQLRVTAKLSLQDKREPLRISSNESQPSKRYEATSSVPPEEVLDFPFGLSSLKMPPSVLSMEDAVTSLESQTKKYGSKYSQTQNDLGCYTFSQSVPSIIRLIHSRIITFAVFAMNQDELGLVSATSNSLGVAGCVFDCLEECVKVAAVAMNEGSEGVIDELNIAMIVQMSVNLSALQSCLPRLFGTITRGLCHLGIIRSENVDVLFDYADSALKKSDKACDNEIGRMYSLVSELFRNKVDSLLIFALENFQWVAKASSSRDIPNTYCDGLIDYLRNTFRCLTAMDEGSKAGLHFSCCGHIAERMTYLLSAPTDATIPASGDGQFLPPISKIDAFGLKNLLLDVQEFQRFANSTRIPQLSECFDELKCLVSAMLDRDLPQLLQPQNDATRKQKYPLLSLNKLSNILEKYQVASIVDKLMISTGGDGEVLMLERKDVTTLIKLIKSQIDGK